MYLVREVLKVSSIKIKAAVAVPEIVEYDISHNHKTVLDYISKAAKENVNLLLFPETVLTGLVISDDYSLDKQYAISLVSEPIKQIQAQAASCGLWVALGFIEIANGILYDSAVLIDSNGTIVLHQRRMSHGWCAPSANPAEYGYGDEYKTAQTPWGKVGFMICGDLFHVNHYATEANLDILLFPFARCFSSNIKLENYQQQWDNVEWPEYAQQISQVNAYALMANYIAPVEGSPFCGGFGGGFITDRYGNLLGQLPLNTAGLGICDMTI